MIEIPKSEAEPESSSNCRRSSRVKVEKEENIAISLLSPVDRKLLGSIKKARKLRSLDDLEEARYKWLPFVALSRIKPELIFRLTDDWSFLNTLSIVNSVTFLPEIKAQRIVKTKSISKKQSLVTWNISSFNKDNRSTSWHCLSSTLAQPPDDMMRQCLVSLKNPKANEEGSWIDSSKIPAQGITVDVQNLPWNQKLLHHSQFIKTKRLN